MFRGKMRGVDSSEDLRTVSHIVDSVLNEQ